MQPDWPVVQTAEKDEEALGDFLAHDFCDAALLRAFEIDMDVIALDGVERLHGHGGANS
jgi:hypothetical protein